MTLDDFIKEYEPDTQRPTEPNCFETDDEEYWYKLGRYDGTTDIIDVLKDSRAALEAGLMAGGSKLSISDTGLIVDFIREWVQAQTNSHGIMLPSDDWDGYDLKSLRNFLASIEKGMRSSTVYEPGECKVCYGTKQYIVGRMGYDCDCTGMRGKPWRSGGCVVWEVDGDMQADLSELLMCPTPDTTEKLVNEIVAAHNKSLGLMEESDETKL